jgi:ABC-type dipeptide/oligopeptide/nickel transport system permease subunit
VLDNLPSEHSLGEQDLGDVVPAEPAQSTRWASAVSLGRLGAVRWGVGIVAGVIVVVFVIPHFFRYGPNQIGAGPPLTPPSMRYLFGTDQLGRNVFARVVIGARYSLLVGITSALGSLIVGGPLGAIAATGGKWISGLIMRAADIVLAFPGILLVIVLAASIGPSLSTTIIALVFFNTAPMARLVRSAILKEKGEDYVLAARVLGSSRRRIVAYHMGVNAVLPVLVFTSLLVSDGMVTEAALSFLGAGIQPPTPSWGNIMQDGLQLILSGTWWVALFPALALIGSVFCINRFAEALGRDLISR